MMWWSRLPLSLPVLHSDWHPICLYPPLSAQLTSLSDLCAHKLHRPPDACAVRNIEQEGSESGGGHGCQILCTFFSKTCSYYMETFSIQLSGKQIPKAAVTACDEHMLLAEAVNLVRISDVPGDGRESGQKESTG